MNNFPSPLSQLEFDHLGRILGGIGTAVKLDSNRSGRVARATFEGHIAAVYDRPGCFGFVGWPQGGPPCAKEIQWEVYGAFARAAVVAHVYLGGLEPAEGFGLACWKEGAPHPTPADYTTMREQMVSAIAHALGVLKKKHCTAALQATRVAIGVGRLRGSATFASVGNRPILDGPRAIETIYGEIPNRCGGIAKGKDAEAKQVFRTAPITCAEEIVVFEPAWLHFGEKQLPRELIRRLSVPPSPIDDHALRPFLIGLSFDFAKSSVEFGKDAHRARAVVNRILTELEKLTTDLRSLFISPRYGDGVAAVIVVNAPSEEAALAGEWRHPFSKFVQEANQQLALCHSLGLRIGLAVLPDERAQASRLAGVSQLSSPAVEPIAQEVVDLSRGCHAPAKELGGVKGRVGIYRLNPDRTVTEISFSPAQ